MTQTPLFADAAPTFSRHKGAASTLAIRVHGPFWQLWATSITGVNLNQHCALSLRGPRLKGHLGFRCDHCGRWATVKPVTILEAAAATGQPRATLFRWVKAGRFTRILGDDGKPRYDLGEIRAAVSEARLSSARNAAPSHADPDTDTTTPTLSKAASSPHNP